MSYPTYFEAYDHMQMLRDYPVGEEFVTRYRVMSRDELFAVQDAQFKKLMQRGWEIPFYQRLWGAQGIEPGSVAELLRAVFGYATWLLIAAVLLLRLVAGWRGRRAAYGTVAGFACAVMVLLIYLVRPAMSASETLR